MLEFQHAIDTFKESVSTFLLLVDVLGINFCCQFKEPSL